MIPARLHRAVAAACLLAVVLVGCDDDDTGDEAQSDEPTAVEPTNDGGGDEAFVEEANALCTEVNGSINALFADLQGPPGPEVFGELAMFGRQFVEDFRALEVPGGDATAIDDALATYDEALDGFEEAAEASDAQAGLAAADAAGVLVAEADAALTEVGVEACQATSGAGGEPPGDDAAEAGATEVPVVLDEYSFGVEPTLAAGPTAFALDNVGEEQHEMVLFKLVEGATVDDALAAEQAGEDPEQFFAGPPEVGVAGPGEQTFVNTELTPGSYAMVCFIPTPEGTPHVAEGMVTSVEVTG